MLEMDNLNAEVQLKMGQDLEYKIRLLDYICKFIHFILSIFLKL